MPYIYTDSNEIGEVMAYREISRDTQPQLFANIPVRLVDFPKLKKTDSPIFTPVGIDALWKSFYNHFTKIPTFLQWYLWSDEERASAAVIVIKKRLSSFIADCLLNPEMPVTIQFFLYMMDVFAKVYPNAPNLAQVRAFMAQFTEDSTSWTRSHFVRAITDRNGLFWLDAQSAARIESGFRDDPITAALVLPRTWFFDEAPGCYCNRRKNKIN